MPRKQKNLGQAELEVLKIVQQEQPVTIGEVSQRIAADSGKARTTVATMVHRLLQKGFLTRKRVDGKFHYTARLNQPDLLRGLVQTFVENTLGGSLSPLVAYLVEKPELTSAEIKQLQKLVREMEPRPAGRH